MGAEQVVYTEEDRSRIAAEKAVKKEARERNKKGEAKSRGRKAGSKNKSREENPKAPFRAFKKCLLSLSSAFKKCLSGMKLTYAVGDSAYGTEDYIRQLEEQGLHLISKLACNAALYTPRAKQRGKGITEGEKFDLYNLDEQYCKEQREDDKYVYKIFQIQALSKSIKGRLLNVVVELQIVKGSGKIGIRILFSTDVNLPYSIMLNYYSLRFQIEFDFRDAKQFFGLSSFKNYKEENLTNFVNLSFFMCLVNKILLKQFRDELQNQKLSLMDLKILFNYRHSAKNIINRVRKSPDLIFKAGFCDTIIPETLINCE